MGKRERKGRMRMRKEIRREENVAVTVALIVIIAALFVAEFFQISATIRKRSLGRMEEGVNTVISEVAAKLERDSRILNATADILSSANNFDIDATRETMETVTPLLETMQIRVLLPNGQILISDGGIIDESGNNELSFEKEAALGEHISDRMASEINGGAPVLRHFVPIVQDGETAALLYGVTRLDELPAAINIDNLYNASASVYIVDTRTGDFILDSRHETLGNMADFDTPDRETRGSLNWDAFTADLLGHGSGYVVFRTPNSGGWQYMYYAPTGINQWSIAVQVPEKEAFASVHAVRRICTAGGILMGLTVIAYYVIIHRQSRRAMSQAVERAVLEEKLKKAEAAERAKTTFLSNMSHDIRTPMNAILGFTALAEANLDNRGRVQEYLNKIMSSGNYLLSLINDILDMSRIESGKLNIEEKPCSISEILRDIRDIIQTQMQSKQLNFVMDAADVTDEDVCCDKLHVNQVLLNLLSNAIKFTPAGGSVSLTIRQKSGAPEGYGRYEIRVKDTGIGMSGEFAEHIFEPFERERTSTVSGIQGTGLGMAITKSIVDAMGGAIEIKTEQGRGTEFIITLDLRLQPERGPAGAVNRQPPEADRDSIPPETADPLKGARLLLVEDNELNREIATELLQESGLVVETAGDGTVAVEKVRTSKPGWYQLILMDIQMPVLDGYGATKAIRALDDPALASIPIVAMTANAFEEDRKTALACGMNDHVTKPINLELLLRVLREQMRGRGD